MSKIGPVMYVLLVEENDFEFAFFIQMNISSRIQVELALFNDHLLAWESLIEPIVDERGEIISPWCIRCSTVTVSY
jgi:hypothetical protein